MEIKHFFIALALLFALPASAQNNTTDDEKRAKLSDNEMSDNLASKKARPLVPDALSREFLYSVSPENPYRVCNPTIVTLSNEAYPLWSRRRALSFRGVLRRMRKVFQS